MGIGLIELGDLAVNGGGFLLDGTVVVAVAGKEEIEEWTEGGDTKDDKNPEEAHFGIVVMVNNIKGDKKRNNSKEDSDREKMAVKKEVKENEEG